MLGLGCEPDRNNTHLCDLYKPTTASGGARALSSVRLGPKLHVDRKLQTLAIVGSHSSLNARNIKVAAYKSNIRPEYTLQIHRK